MAGDNNCLKIPYKIYAANSVKKLVEQIPEEERIALAEQISARAFLFGCENEPALQLALKHLAIEQDKEESDKNGREQ